MTEENKLLISAGVISVGIVGYYFYKKSADGKKLKLEQVATAPPKVSQQPSNLPSNQASPKQEVSVINYKKKLKRGSKGIEVQKLQEMLGIQADGVFGGKTLTALINQKGVVSITLEQMAIQKKKEVSQPKTERELLEEKHGAEADYFVKTEADKKQKEKANQPKKGQWVMANLTTVNAYKPLKRDDGNYYNSGEKIRSFDYGKKIGRFVLGWNDNNNYLVQTENIGLVIVKGSQVLKMK